jgi:calcium/calmodulin-dependent protein kinase kinase 2
MTESQPVHAQGVVHRDIKPDNLLLTDDDVLKVVDFGVSEMFNKPEMMVTAKSAGSPAFLPPEMCIAKHGDIAGKAADIWSMGVTLYCLKYGHLPFQRDNVLEMYEAIKTEEPSLPPAENPDFVELMHRLLDKDPKTRISMAELRVSTEERSTPRRTSVARPALVRASISWVNPASASTRASSN